MEKLKLLDLFCGSGGAAMGYHRAGFEIVGVDIKPQKRYPFEFHQGDAMTYPLNGFDVIHASPPCQRYSTCTPIQYRKNHPDLIAPIRNKLKGKIYIIENVPNAKKHLLQPIMLCGSMFGLNIQRHRYFEINPLLPILLPPCNHKKNPIYISGSTGSSKSPTGFKRFDYTVQERRDAIDCQWMTDHGLDEAIPPAYTEWIGKLIIKNLF